MPKHRAQKEAADGSKKKSKSGTAAAAEKVTDAPKSPYDEFFDRLQAFQKERGILGHMLVRGIPRSGDSEDEDEEEEEVDNSKLSEEQMNSLRFIMITKSRADKLDEMRKFVLGDQADESFMMFNTSFSYGVHDGFYQFKDGKFGRTKKWQDKFDLLFAYTHTLKEFDVWMHDNEGGMDGMVRELAGLWKRVLKKSDEELGIDSEYTRPGVLVLLEDFKKEVEPSYSEPPFKFKYT